MIEKARPEDIGISPNTITKALDDIDRKKVPIHSLLMMRHGKIFLEAYWAPWTADKLHRLYSITKSFTALLIGCLEEEGKLSTFTVDGDMDRVKAQYIEAHERIGD